MFALLHNFYTYCKVKSERKITLALLGLDNAGKTTLLNTLKGEVDQDTTPTFGFNSSTLQEGKYKLEVFDLGGGKSIRGVWKKYLAEVHAIVYVVDAADAQRFEESRKTMEDALESEYMRDKPVLVFANKQDLPAAASAADVVKGLGLAACRNSHNVFACTARTAPGAPHDPRLREGMRWLVGCVDRDFSKLDPRVQAEAETARQEEAAKRKERQELLRKQREERLQQEAQRAREVEKENVLHDGSVLVAAAPAAAGHPGDQAHQQLLEPATAQPPPHLLHGTGLALGLPHTIESPGKLPPPRRGALHEPSSPGSDLRSGNQDQGAGALTATQPMGPASGRPSLAGSNHATLPPLRAPPTLPPLAPATDDSSTAGAPAEPATAADADARGAVAARLARCGSGRSGGSSGGGAASDVRDTPEQGGGGDSSGEHRRLTGTTGGASIQSDGGRRGSFGPLLTHQSNKVAPA